MKKLWIAALVFCLPMLTWADARFVEAPAECHVPYDNANVDNEFKLVSCDGMLKSRNGGATYDAVVAVDERDLPGNFFVIDGQDVRDIDAYPSGELEIATSGTDSGTACNVVVADTVYSTPYWTARTWVRRTQNRYRVDVQYELNCNGATTQ